MTKTPKDRSLRRLKKELAHKVKRWQSTKCRYTQIAAYGGQVTVTEEAVSSPRMWG